LDCADSIASDDGPDTGKKEQPPAPNIARTAKETNPIRALDMNFPCKSFP
jgi:hypothetical protein